MDGVLRFLTQSDNSVLRNKAQLARLQPGHYLIREGRPPAGMFIIRSGRIAVQRVLGGRPVSVAEFGQDTLLGESAMLRPAGATASVVALVETESYVFTPERMAELFRSDPGLFGRFYQSLAWLVSRRLREMNELTGGDPFARRFGKIPDWELI